MDYDQVKEFILGGYDPYGISIDGFHINQGLSDQDTVVYESSSQVVVVFPGTRLGLHTTALRDLGADTRIVTGTESTAERWRRAERMATAVQQHAHRHNKQVHAVGHSLGGNVAMHVSDKTGIPTTVVNPAVLYPTSSGHKDANYNHVTLYYSPNDPIAKNSSQIPQSTGITSKQLQPHEQDFWSKGGITNWLNHHKAVKYGLEAAGAVVGAAAVVATGGMAAPEVAALGEAAVTAEETIPLLSEVEEEVTLYENGEWTQQASELLENNPSTSSIASTALNAATGAVAGAQATERAISGVDSTAKAINGVLNHHSVVNNQPVNTSGITTNTTSTSSTSETPPAPRSTLTAYSSSGYGKIDHQSGVTGTSLMTNYTKKKYRKQKVRRTR